MYRTGRIGTSDGGMLTGASNTTYIQGIEGAHSYQLVRVRDLGNSSSLVLALERTCWSFSRACSTEVVTTYRVQIPIVVDRNVELFDGVDGLEGIIVERGRS